MYRIGIDLGGTNIAAGLVDEQFRIVAKESTPTLVGRPNEAIVDDIAAGEYQKAFAAQRSEQPADFETLIGCEPAAYRELYNGNVSFGKHVAQDRPCAVVYAPFVVYTYTASERVKHRFCKLCAAFSRIFEIIKLLRKTVHVIYLFGLCGALHKQTLCIPVG